MSESTALTLASLQDAVANRAAAFRCRATLQPAGGEGTKVFPPTYAGAVYATEHRRLPGHDQPVPCVLIDSVQSQANRMEQALQDAVDEGRLVIPVIEVDFSPYFDAERAALPADQRDDMDLLDPVGRVSSLQAPHRIADAILRDSLVEAGDHGDDADTPFRQSQIGRRLDRVSTANATALYELCPTALVFGMWDSTGPRGGLGAKFERAMVSEIVGINAVAGVKTSSRIDPLGVQLKAGPLYAAKDGGWTLDEAEAKVEKKKPVTLGKDGRPSEANHGNVTPSLSDRDRDGTPLAGGVTVDHVELSAVLSLAALRRLKFPPENQDWQPTDEQRKRDTAGQTVLAALALCAAALADEAGHDLRSRCALWGEHDLRWEQLQRGGGGVGSFTLTGEQAIALLNDAVKAATEAGLTWRTEPLKLKPSEQLVKLVVKSQNLAAKQGGDAGEDGAEGGE